MSNHISKQLQEVSRAHSIRRSAKKERIQSGDKRKKLHPQYIMGFIDGEGSFCVSIYYDKTMRNKVFIRPEFSIELRADDKEILERIQRTLGCGRVYDCRYKRYGWYPHVKYKVSRLDEVSQILIPFIERHKLKAKKRKRFELFKKIVEKRMRGEHLAKRGVREIIKLRKEIRKLGKKHPRLKTAKVRENRSPGGVGR